MIMAANGNDALFKPDVFDQALQDTEQPLPLFRTQLAQGSEWLTQQFQAGIPVEQLVHLRCWFVDQLLIRAWQQHTGIDDQRFALTAVGGYGRGELHPGSDVDIMILTAVTLDSPAQLIIEGFIRCLWDVGLEVGHSVRTLRQCVEEAERDITVMTNIMEARLLTGSAALFDDMRELTNPKRIWSSEDFFAAKYQEQTARHAKYDDTAYNLEPNIKENPGGLRDIQMIGWVLKRHFDTPRLDDLVKQGFLTQIELNTLIDGQHFLWKIRFALHIRTNRREDRLLFDHQKALAEQFGFHDNAQHLGVEQFMQTYYRTVMELNRLNEMLLQLFEEVILLAAQPTPPRIINNRFQSTKGYLEVRNAKVFAQYPFALLELFLIMQQHQDLKGVRATTIRLVRDHRNLIDDDFRTDLRNRSLFMEILRQPRGITHELRRMNRYGILAAYLPVFENIVGRMQYDLFHAFTVDQHTLFVVRNLRRFSVTQFTDEFPRCSQIVTHLPKLELLYIAGLFHDIAKGRGGDHSVLGKEYAREFCQQHGLSDYDTELVCWLVENHLLLSVTAQKKDISDPEVIHQFATLIGDPVRLDYLYALTVADVRATNPKLWNSWKDALFLELYTATKNALHRGLENPIQRLERIKHTKSAALAVLSEHHISHKCVDELWQELTDEYFLRYSDEEIVRHTKAILKHPLAKGKALVITRQNTRKGSTEFFLYAKDHGRSFATAASVFDQLGLTILDARVIRSSNNHTLDTYLVLEQDGSMLNDRYKIDQITQYLQNHINDEQSDLEVTRYAPRQIKHFPMNTRVEFHHDQHNECTVMELTAADRPGLLSIVGKALAHCEIRLQNARIATFGSRVEDVFYIVNTQESPIDETAIQCLRREIVEKLNKNL